LALILVALEMATGTFYLLMVAIAMAIGGAFALIGIAFSAQLALAGLAGIAGIVLLARLKGKHSSDAMTFSLDIGQPVEVLAWRENGTARVFYRGTEWDAELEANGSGHEGNFYIKDVRGSVLVLTNRKPI
jgi:membrane protein implicated in regulation of membrane protease activity